MPVTLEEHERRIGLIEEDIQRIGVSLDAIIYMLRNHLIDTIGEDAVEDMVNQWSSSYAVSAIVIEEYEFPEGYGEGLGSLTNEELASMFQELDDLGVTTPEEIDVIPDELFADALKRAGVHGWEGTD